MFGGEFPGFQSRSSAASLSPTNSKYHSRNLSKVNLKKVERFRTRDLFQSHAERLGKTREEVEKQAKLYPHRPRTTPVMKLSDYPSIPSKLGSADPTLFGRQLRNSSLSDVSKVDQVWLQNRRREANQKRLKQHTQRLLDQWSRQLARFEEETTWRQETSFTSEPHLMKIQGGKDHRQQKDRFWVQDAWSQVIENGEDDGEEEEEEDTNKKQRIPRVSMWKRNESRSYEGTKSLEKGKRFSEENWMDKQRRGRPGAFPGMKINQKNGIVENANDVPPTVYGSPLVSDKSAGTRKDPFRAIRNNPADPSRPLEPRGMNRDPVSFSPFAPYSMYKSRAFLPRSNISDGVDESVDVGLANGRIQCDQIKQKLARYGIHVKRGNLERALLAPNLELTEQQKMSLPNLLFDLPTKQARAKTDSKKRKKKKTTKKKKGKGKTQ